MQDLSVMEISLNPEYLMSTPGLLTQYFAWHQNAIVIYGPRLTTEVRGSSHWEKSQLSGAWVFLYLLHNFPFSWHTRFCIVSRAYFPCNYLLFSIHHLRVHVCKWWQLTSSRLYPLCGAYPKFKDIETHTYTIIYLSEECLHRINQQPNWKFKIASGANEKQNNWQ